VTALSAQAQTDREACYFTPSELRDASGREEDAAPRRVDVERGDRAVLRLRAEGDEAVTRPELLAFLRRHRLCVQASVSSAGIPQAAVVGFAVSDDLEIMFDTIGTSRKMANLRRNGHIALVVGWDNEQTVQIDGVADEPKGGELDRLKKVYFASWPDGVERQSWKDITYVRVRPTWARYSDFRPGGRIVKLGEAELRRKSGA
jgi:hypothetical protein